MAASSKVAENLSRHDQLGARTFAELAAGTDCEDMRTFFQSLNGEFRFPHRPNFFPAWRVIAIIDSLIDVVTSDAFFGGIRVPDQLLRISGRVRRLTLCRRVIASYNK